MKARIPEYLHPKIDVILDRATNVLSVIHPHVYFPTYSNGLKEIGRFLGFQRADENATGLDSIVWRQGWHDNAIPDIKARLVQYNQDDCRQLKHTVIHPGIDLSGFRNRDRSDDCSQDHPN